MGKKGNWFVSVKKAFSPESKEKKDQKSSKSKKKWGSGSQKHEEPSFSSIETAPPPAPPPPPPSEEVKVVEPQNEQSKQAYPVAVATAAAAEVARLSNFNKYPGKSKEEGAAIMIQTAFRRYLARRALQALRGLVRLKTLIDGHSVKRQATSTLLCMQTLARVQSQINAGRIRMSEENQALQRQLQLKHEKELENLRASMGEEWDDSIQSKEQTEASLLSKQEAAIRRERVMAYAYSHQQMSKNSRPGNTLFMDPQNPHWGWSWLERWMAFRPLESRSTTDKELNDHSSVKSATCSTSVGEITKAYYAGHELKVEKPSPTAKKPVCQLPSTPSSKLPPSSLMTGKLKSASPKAMWAADDGSRSILSMQSERPRRHSIAGSSVRDDESLASSPSVPSYMAPTESARAKARLNSPLGAEKVKASDKGLTGTVKKRLFLSASPAGMRRHSGPPKVESQLIKDIGVGTEQSVSNGNSSR